MLGSRKKKLVEILPGQLRDAAHSIRADLAKRLSSRPKSCSMEFPFVMFSALIFSTDVPLFLVYLFIFSFFYLFPHLFTRLFDCIALSWLNIWATVNGMGIISYYFFIFFCMSILLNLSNHLGHYVVD